MTRDQRTAIVRAEQRLARAKKNYNPDDEKSVRELDAAFHGLDVAKFYYYVPKGDHD